MQSIGNDPYPLSNVYEVGPLLFRTVSSHPRLHSFLQQCFGNVTHFVDCDQEEDVMKCLRSTATSSLIAAISGFSRLLS